MRVLVIGKMLRWTSWVSTLSWDTEAVVVLCIAAAKHALD